MINEGVLSMWGTSSRPVPLTPPLYLCSPPSSFCSWGLPTPSSYSIRAKTLIWPIIFVWFFLLTCPFPSSLSHPIFLLFFPIYNIPGLCARNCVLRWSCLPEQNACIPEHLVGETGTSSHKQEMIAKRIKEGFSLCNIFEKTTARRKISPESRSMSKSEPGK